MWLNSVVKENIVKKKLSLVLVTLLTALAVSACGGTKDTKKESAKAAEPFTVVDGYPVYLISEMTPEQFPELLGVYSPIEDATCKGLSPFSGSFVLHRADDSVLEDRSYSDIDKIVIHGVTIDSSLLSFDRIWDFMEVMNSVIPVSYTSSGISGLGGSKVEGFEEGMSDLSSEYFMNGFPQKIEENEYSRFGKISFDGGYDGVNLSIEMGWSPEGDMNKIAIYFDIDRQLDGPDIDYFTLYFNIDGDKVGVIMDTFLGGTYYGDIYLDPEA